MPAQSGNQPELITLENWPAGGLNQTTGRSTIGNEDLWWIENFIPLSSGELRTAWGPSEPIYTAPPGVQILRIFFCPMNDWSRGGTSSLRAGFMFRSDGQVDQVDLDTGAVIPLGQVWQPIAPVYWASLKLWRPTWIGHTVGEQGGAVIGSPQGLYAWDGQTLTSPGEQPPLWLTNGATTDEAGDPLVMPVGLPGIYALEVYKQRLFVMGQTVISFSGPSNGADFSASGGGGSFGYFGDQLTMSYTDLAATAGFLYCFGDSCVDAISSIQMVGTAVASTAVPSITAPQTTEFQYQNYNPQIGQQVWRPVGEWLQAFAVFDGAGAFMLSGDGQMAWISQKLTNLWWTLDHEPFEGTIAAAHIFGQRWLLFNGTFTDPWNIKRNLMLAFNGQIWTVLTQGMTLTHIGHYEQASIIEPYGTDGTSLYKLFDQPDPKLEKRFATKAYTADNAITLKAWKRLYLQMRDIHGGPEGSFVTGDFVTADGGIPNGAEQVSFEVQPGCAGIRPFPTIGQGISAYLDLTSRSPDFAIERLMIAYEVRTIFGA